VLTAGLSRGSSAAVARRERALDLSGFREFRHGLWLRPDNLAGGRVVVATHLRLLGLDEAADTLEVRLDGAQVAELEPGWNVAGDHARARALTERIHRFLARGQRQSRRARAAESYWLGDEVLRFLARDPLLPRSMADPEPRARLAEAMAALDEQGFALWSTILEELEA
jgi:phenylacetic acid degradation operon negative regulatory protein